jgi:hypothetical protein
VKDATSEFFFPIQLGVGFRGATEAIVHVLRQWLVKWRPDRNRIVVTVDIENAFNCLDRSAILSSVRRVLPSLAPWADYCYRNRSHLFTEGDQLDSARGVQQGDPLGPAFFAIAIQDSIRRARVAAEEAVPGGIDWVAFYLDDGTVAGHADAVEVFVNTFMRDVADLGLNVARRKCEAIPAAGVDTEILSSRFDGFHWITDGNFKILGAPFGTPEFIESIVAERTLKAETLLRNLLEYPDPQGALLLIRQCCSWCKLVYSSRTIPTSLQVGALHSFSISLRKSLGDLVGDALDDRQWAQAGLSISSGGLGIRDPLAHAPAAYLASVSSSAELCKSIYTEFDVHDACGASSCTIPS